MNNLTLPQQIERLDADRFRAYSENLAFYGGAQWAGRTRRKERRLTFNYARSFIDKITSYLMADIGFSIDPNGRLRRVGPQGRGSDALPSPPPTGTTTCSSSTSTPSLTPPSSAMACTK